MLVMLTAANVSEYQGARELLAKLHHKHQQFPRLTLIWGDAGYRGQDFIKWVMDTYRWIIEVIQRRDCL